MGNFKRALLLAMLSSIVLTTGCSPFVENNMIEEIAPVIFWSIDDGGEGKLKMSTLVPPLIKEKKRLLSLQVDLIRQGGKEFNLKYYRELKTGQLRMVFINEEVAKKGIVPLINTLVTDPDISERLYLVIVKGNFDDYIKNQLEKQAELDYFLYRMFKHYEKNNQGEMSIVNLHQFIKRLYSPFSDPILPVFNVGKESFTYEGTAIFSNDKLVATVKNMDDQIFQLIDNERYLKLLPIPALSVTMGRVRSNVHMEWIRKYSSISIKVDLSGRIEEYWGDKNLLDPKELAGLNKEIKSYLEEQTTKLLTKIQQWKADPLQLGNLSLSPFSKPITKKDWISYWEQMKINVDYRLHILPLSSVNQ
jgi:spore germination protein